MTLNGQDNTASPDELASPNGQREGDTFLLEEREGELTLIVEDDGHGFDAGSAPDGPGDVPLPGLLGVRERVAAVDGTRTVESGPGGPTTLFARIPTSRGGERGRHD